MTGMDRSTGKPLSGIAHLKQSVRDIMLTSPQTRIMRREYGCGVRDLVDAPINASSLTSFYASAAEALDKYEPRIRVSRIYGELDEENNLILTVEGYYKHDGSEIILEGIAL